jgi:hypothetical protein
MPQRVTADDRNAHRVFVQLVFGVNCLRLITARGEGEALPRFLPRQIVSKILAVWPAFPHTSPCSAARLNG